MRAHALTSRLRERLEIPKCLLTARDFGFGLGVARFKITDIGARILYTMHQSSGNFISAEEISQSLYKKEEIKTDARKLVMMNIYRLRHEFLPGTRLTIVNSQNKREYKLEETI